MWTITNYIGVILAFMFWVGAAMWVCSQLVILHKRKNGKITDIDELWYAFLSVLLPMGIMALILELSLTDDNKKEDNH